LVVKSPPPHFYDAVNLPFFIYLRRKMAEVMFFRPAFAAGLFIKEESRGQDARATFADDFFQPLFAILFPSSASEFHPLMSLKSTFGKSFTQKKIQKTGYSLDMNLG